MKFFKSRWQIILFGATIAVLAGSALAVTAASARSNVGAPVKADSNTNHTVTVGGEGQVDVPPDLATLTLGVDTRASDAQTALSQNAAAMNAVIAAVKNQGVPANHIQTSDLSLYRDSENGVYVASHRITVRLDNVDKVGQVLDAAVAAGANNAWGVSFGLKDQSAARSQALQAAVSDARTRAEGIAKGLGVSITGVGSASEVSFQTSPIRYAGAAPQPAVGSSTSVQPGQLTVIADVKVTYTFG